ncbi:MAG: HNH endonuclease [Chloroflexi bacterium]|nr:HNH endonuclease [Chloroflexota bacterium]
MDGSVLVLNATYEPLNVVSIRRAIVLLLKEKAEVVEAAAAVLRAERRHFEYPLVIRLVTYVKVPRQMGLPLTRRTVLARDQYTCQYCGTQPGKNHLTVDHIVPRSKGGLTVWENVVAACAACNQRKGNRTPSDATMPLRSKPARPRYVAIVLLGHANAPRVWHKYLQSA